MSFRLLKAFGIIPVLTILLVISIPLNGCLKEWDSEEVKSWYDESPQNFEGYMDQSRKMIQAGRVSRAKKYLEEAITFVESQFGPYDVRIATAADELGVIQEKEGLYAAAEGTYRKAYEARKKNLQPGSPDLVRTQKKLAEILIKLDKRDEAQKVTDELDSKRSRPSKANTNSDTKPKRRKR